MTHKIELEKFNRLSVFYTFYSDMTYSKTRKTRTWWGTWSLEDKKIYVCIRDSKPYPLSESFPGMEDALKERYEEFINETLEKELLK